MYMSTEVILKAATAIVAVGGLVFTILQFIHVQEMEASRPYLEKKLGWCEEAVETASGIANSDDNSEEKRKRFWEMYWGVMGLVENKQVTEAMVTFGQALQSGGNLRHRSLAIAHACRAEMAKDWSSRWAR
jgi:hypothetical protein